MRDTSLDEFLGEDGEQDEDAELDENAELDAGEEDEEDEDAELDADDENEDAELDADDENEDAVTGAEGGDERLDGEAPVGVTAADIPVEPAVATYGWTPGGAECQKCEKIVERRWRDEGGLVCADCKVW